MSIKQVVIHSDLRRPDQIYQASDEVEQKLTIQRDGTVRLDAISHEGYPCWKEEKEIDEELKHAEFIIDQKRHVAMDTHEYFNDIYKYLKKQKDIDKSILDKADSIDRFLSEIERKYESISKEK